MLFSDKKLAESLIMPNTSCETECYVKTTYRVEKWCLDTICGLGKLFLSSGAPEEIKDVKYLFVSEGLPF